MIDREVFDWGVRLTAHPFRGTADHAMTISSEIRNYRDRRGSEVLISFPAASMQKPLRLLDAQTWHMALGQSSRKRRPSRPRCGRPPAKARRRAESGIDMVGRQGVVESALRLLLGEESSLHHRLREDRFAAGV